MDAGLSVSSRYVVRLACPRGERVGSRCSRVAAGMGLGVSGVVAVGTEALWVPLSLRQGGGAWGVLLAQGMAVSFIAVKLVCAKDILDELQDSPDVEALGRTTGKCGTVVRITSSLLVAGVGQTALVFQLAHSNGSLWQGIVGGGGDLPIPWYSVDRQLRYLARHEGFSRQQRLVRQVKNRIVAEIDAMIQRCNRSEAGALLQTLDAIDVASSDALGAVMQEILWPVPLGESGWITAGRSAMDIGGAGLTGSHIWMMGGLGYQGAKRLFGHTIGLAGGAVVGLCSLGITVESIGLAPRNFYDGIVGWWKGERPLFSRYNVARGLLLGLATVEAGFAISSALDGANQTTSGTARKIQRPAASAGLAMMAWWGSSYVVRRCLRAMARRSKYQETLDMAEVATRLESVQHAVREMRSDKFAQLMLDMPEEERNRLIGELTVEGLRELAGGGDVHMSEVV